MVSESYALPSYPPSASDTGSYLESADLFCSQVVQLNSLRPTNDQFCANLRVRLKAALPMMKSLKPFANTFFSEWFLSPEREQEEMKSEKEPKKEPKVEELISFDDKGKGKEVDESREWTTEWGIDGGFHIGLYVLPFSTIRSL